MKITKLTPEAQILKEFAARLARIRKVKGFTQAELATEAGIGIATLRRIESGQDCQLGSWIKLFKALEMINTIDGLIPNSLKSPMAEVLGSNSQNRKKSTKATKIVWGDEIK